MKKAVFLSVAKTLYKKSEVDLTDDLKTVTGDDIDDAEVEKLITKFDAEKVADLKTKETERFNNGIKKGTLETATKFEKAIKKALNVETDLVGDEFLTHIETDVVPNLNKGGKEGVIDFTKITDEDLKKVPAYIRKENEHKTALQTKEQEKLDAVNAEKEAQKQTGFFSKASNKALAILESKKPILPADAVKAQTLKEKLLVDELKGYKFIDDGKGNPIPMGEDGKQLQNANGVDMSFEELVGSIADKNFEYQAATPRTPVNNKNNPSPANPDAKYTGEVPTSKEKYIELLMDGSIDLEQKTILKDTYSEQFSD